MKIDKREMEAFEDKVIKVFDNATRLLSVIFLPPPKPKDKCFKFKDETFEKPCTRLSKILPMLLSVNYSPIIVYYENYLIINE